jgi:hypothetical protein
MKMASSASESARPLDRLVVKCSGSMRFIRVAEIDWIEAAGVYVNLHVAGSWYSRFQPVDSKSGKYSCADGGDSRNSNSEAPFISTVFQPCSKIPTVDCRVSQVRVFGTRQVEPDAHHLTI